MASECGLVRSTHATRAAAFTAHSTSSTSARRRRHASATCVSFECLAVELPHLVLDHRAVEVRGEDLFGRRVREEADVVRVVAHFFEGSTFLFARGARESESRHGTQPRKTRRVRRVGDRDWAAVGQRRCDSAVDHARPRPPRPHPPRRARGVAECNLTPSASTASATPTVAVVVVVVAMAFGTAPHLFPVSMTCSSRGSGRRSTGRRCGPTCSRADGGRVPRRGVRVRLVGAGAAALMLLELARAPGDALLPRDGDAEARLRGDVLRRPARLLPATAATIDTAAEAEAERRAEAEDRRARRHEGSRRRGSSSAPRSSPSSATRNLSAQIRARNSRGAQFSRRAILGAIL